MSSAREPATFVSSLKPEAGTELDPALFRAATDGPNGMSWFDSDSSTATSADSEVVQGLRGATRLFERYELAITVALFFTVTTAFGLAWHSVATQQIGNNMSALVVWFSVIFAAGAAILGGTIKLWAAVQERRRDLT